MKEYNLEEPLEWDSSFETVMAAYDKRMSLGKQELDQMLSLEVVSVETSQNGAVTIVEREVEMELDCPEWLKTLIGHKTIKLRQRNVIDRERRTLETEGWNCTLEGSVELSETCRYYAHLEKPNTTCFEQNAVMSVRMITGIDNLAEWYASQTYEKCAQVGRELLEEYINEMKGQFQINPFSVTSPHSLGDGRDDVPIIKKIGIALPDTEHNGADEQVKEDSLSASEARRRNKLISRSFSSSNVAKEGQLMKWTNYYSQWQPRHFTLESGVFSYFEKKTDKLPKGSIAVEDMEITTKSDTDNEFVVKGTDDVEYYLMARDSKERSEWIRSLGSAKAQNQVSRGSDAGIRMSTDSLVIHADEEAASRALDILVAELELYEELLRKQGEVLAEATADGELRAEKQEFAEQAVLYRTVSKGLMLLLQESVTAITKEERQVRLDCESERVKRSQIKKQIQTARDRQRSLSAKLGNSPRALSPS